MRTITTETRDFLDELGLEVPFAEGNAETERFEAGPAWNELGESPFAEAPASEGSWQERPERLQAEPEDEGLAWLDVEAADANAEAFGAEDLALDDEGLHEHEHLHEDEDEDESLLDDTTRESEYLDDEERDASESYEDFALQERFEPEAEATAAGAAPLTAQQRAWILALDRSAIERLPDAATRTHFLQQDWSDVEFPGNVPKGQSATVEIKRHWALARSLFNAMVGVVMERRVPTMIRFRDRPVVKVPGQPSQRLFGEARDAFVRMREAAKAEGVDLVILSSWRSRARQAAASANQPNPAAVARKASAHMYGLAIDLRMGVPGLPVKEINTRVDRATAAKAGTAAKMGNLVRMYRSPVYKWMSLRAREFGWYPYRNEPWHWEYNPPGFKARFEGKATAVANANEASCANEAPWEQHYNTSTESEEAGATAAPLAHTFDAKVLGVKVAVLVTRAARTASQVEMLVYAHGLDLCKPVLKDRPMTFITGRPFKLGDLVEASGRPMVLVVPFLDWERLAQNGMAFGRKWHKLAKPEIFNRVASEVLEQVRAVTGRAAAPTLQRLIVAGHSRAFGFFDALAHAHATAEMRQGALGRLTHVWALDTTYTAPIAEWRAWLRSRDDFNVTVVYRHGSYRTRTAEIKALATGVRGKQFDVLAAESRGRLSVIPVAAGQVGHCEIPAAYLPRLLAALPAMSAATLSKLEPFGEAEGEAECEDREFEESWLEDAPSKEGAETTSAFGGEAAAEGWRESELGEDSEEESDIADFGEMASPIESLELEGITEDSEGESAEEATAAEADESIAAETTNEWAGFLSEALYTSPLNHEELMREPTRTKPEEVRLRPHVNVVDEQDKPITDGDYAFRQGNTIERGQFSKERGGFAFFGKVDPARPFVFEIGDRACAIRSGAFLDPDDPGIEYGGSWFDWTLVRDYKNPDKEFWPHYLMAMKQDTGPDTSRRSVDRFWQHEHITRRPIQLTQAARQGSSRVVIQAIPMQIRSGPLARYTDHGRATIWLELVTPGMVKLYVKDDAGGQWQAYASTVRVGGRYFAIVEVDGLKEGSYYQYTLDLAPLPGAGPVPMEPQDFKGVFPVLNTGTRNAIGEQLKKASRQGSTWLRFRTLRRKYDKSLRFATGSCRWYPGDEVKGWKPDKLGPDMLDGLGDWLRRHSPPLWPEFLFFGGDQIYADEIGDKHHEEIIRGRFSSRLPGPTDRSATTVSARLVDGAWAGRFAHRYKEINPLSKTWLKHARVVKDGLKKLDSIYADYPILKSLRDDLVTKQQLVVSYETERNKRRDVAGAKQESDYEKKMREAIQLLPKVEALEISTAPYQAFQPYWLSAREDVEANPRAYRYRACNFLLWSIPTYERELPTLPDQAPSEIGVRKSSQHGHPSANEGRHAADFAEYSFLYERAWTSSANVRLLLGNVPTFLMFDDHEVTDDWNVDAAWMRMIHSPKDHYRMWPKTITDALCAYWMYQGWGNKPPSQWKKERDPRAGILATAQRAGTDALPELRKLIHAACVAVPTTRPPGTPDVTWHYRLPFDPPFLVPDCRSRKRMIPAEDDLMRIDHDKNPPQSQTLDKGQIDWMRGALSASKDPVAFIAPSTPLLLPKAPMQIMTDPGAFAKAWAADSTFDTIRALIAPTPSPRLTKIFRRAKDLEHMVRDKSWRDLWDLAAGKKNTAMKTLVLVSGDVHHSYCMTANLPGSGRTKPEILQITSSGLQTTIRSDAKTWVGELKDSAFKQGQYRIMPGFMSDGADRPSMALYQNSVAIVDVKLGAEVDINVTHLTGKSSWYAYKYTSGAAYMRADGSAPAFSPKTVNQGEAPVGERATYGTDGEEATVPWLEDALAPDDSSRVQETFLDVLGDSWSGGVLETESESGTVESRESFTDEALDAWPADETSEDLAWSEDERWDEAETIGNEAQPLCANCLSRFDEAADAGGSMEAMHEAFESELDAIHRPRRDTGASGGSSGSGGAMTLNAGSFGRFVASRRLDLAIADILRALDTYPSGSWAKQVATFVNHELDVGNLVGIFSSLSVAKAKAAVPGAEQAKVESAAAGIGNGVTVHFGGTGAWKGVSMIADSIVQAGKSPGPARERFAEVLTHELMHFRNRDFFIDLEASAPSANPSFYVDLAKANAYDKTPRVAWYVMGEVACNHIAWRVLQDLRNRSRGTPVPTNPNVKGFYRYALALDGGGWPDNGYLADLKTAGRYNEQIALWMLKVGGEKVLYHDDAARTNAVRQLFKDVYNLVKPAFAKPTERDDGGV